MPDGAMSTLNIPGMPLHLAEGPFRKCQHCVLRSRSCNTTPLLLCAVCRSFPVPWLLLAFLVYWLINTYFFPPKPKA
jgi:hypothetical protein